MLKEVKDFWSNHFWFSEHLGTEHALFVLDPTRTFIGGVHPPTLSRRRRDDAKDFVGCINDVQFNGHPLNYYNETSNLGIAISVGGYNLNFRITYPSPRLTLTLTSPLGQNVGLGEG